MTESEQSHKTPENRIHRIWTSQVIPHVSCKITYLRARLNASEWMKRVPVSKKKRKVMNQCVSKVEEGADNAGDLELRHVIENAVHEVVDGGESTRQERSPPPVIVLHHTHYITAAIYITIFITSLQLFIVIHHTHYITYSPTSHELHHCSYC